MKRPAAYVIGFFRTCGLSKKPAEGGWARQWDAGIVGGAGEARPGMLKSTA